MSPDCLPRYGENSERLRDLKWSAASTVGKQQLKLRAVESIAESSLRKVTALKSLISRPDRDSKVDW